MILYASVLVSMNDCCKFWLFIIMATFFYNLLSILAFCWVKKTFSIVEKIPLFCLDIIFHIQVVTNVIPKHNKTFGIFWLFL